MRNIRNGVFETNSSSMHSLSVIGTKKFSQRKYEEETHVFEGEFGWGYEVLSEPVEKLSYLITYYRENKDMLERISRIFEEYTGSTLIIHDEEEYEGYIDHESMDCLNGDVTDDDSIRDIIFSDSHTIIIDNDNH